MRLMQVRDGRARRVVATDRGRSWIVGGRSHTVLDLAKAAIAKRTTIAKLVKAAPEPRRGRSGGAAGRGPRAAADRSSRPGASAGHRHRTDPSRLGGDARFHACQGRRADAEATLTNSMKMFRMGLEGGKPAKGETGVQPEWFYKGDGSFVAAPGEAAHLAGLRRGRRRGAGGRRHLSGRPRRPARGGSASRSSTNSPTTSWSGRTISFSPIPSCGRARSGRSCCSATCRTTSAAFRASAAATR